MGDAGDRIWEPPSGSASTAKGAAVLLLIGTVAAFCFRRTVDLGIGLGLRICFGGGDEGGILSLRGCARTLIPS